MACHDQEHVQNGDCGCRVSKRNFRSFIGLAIPATLSCITGLLLSGLPMQSLLQTVFGGLLLHFSEPLSGCESLSEHLVRILFFASPTLLAGILLLTSLFFRNARRVLRIQISAYMLLSSLWLGTVFRCGDVASSAFTAVCAVTILCNSALVFLLGYRVMLCNACGLGTKTPVPGTWRRLCSFLLRFLVWTIAVTVVRIVLLMMI